MTSQHFEILQKALNDAEKVYEYLEKIQTFEEHEMAPGTPNPDIYFNSLYKAKDILKNYESIRRKNFNH